MKNTKLKFSDFESNQISKKQQKTIQGGDGEGTINEPKNGGGGNGNG